MKRLKFFILILCCGVLNAKAIGQQRIPQPNEKIISSLTVNNIVQLLDSLNLNGALQINVEDEQPEARWAYQQLLDTLVQGGWEVFDKPDKQESVIRLNLTGYQASVRYETVSRKWLFFPSKIHRTIEVNWHLIIVNSDDRVLFSSQIQRVYDDVFEAKFRKTIETLGLDFTKGSKQHATFTDKVLEPLLVTTTSVAVIYLFYTLRKGK